MDSKKISSIKLNKSHWKILKRFISEEELLSLLKEEKVIKAEVKKSSEIIFYTKKRGAQDLGFVYIRGIIDLGLEFENLFLDRKQKEKIKNGILEKSKRSILENALILSVKKEVDLNEILKFLTK
ncbi:MAG: hypothetical protein GXO21_04120 [Aquificae bacterium]|nr:hypothetical protein [Aquificota bacterium]